MMSKPYFFLILILTFNQAKTLATETSVFSCIRFPSLSVHKTPECLGNIQNVNTALYSQSGE